MMNIEYFKNSKKSFFSVKDIQIITGVSNMTVYKWIKSKTLIAEKNERDYFVLPSNLEKLLDKINNKEVRLVRGTVPKIKK